MRCEGRGGYPRTRGAADVAAGGSRHRGSKYGGEAEHGSQDNYAKGALPMRRGIGSSCRVDRRVWEERTSGRLMRGESCCCNTSLGVRRSRLAPTSKPSAIGSKRTGVNPNASHRGSRFGSSRKISTKQTQHFLWHRNHHQQHTELRRMRLQCKGKRNPED
jgi:hypothetical protein